MPKFLLVALFLCLSALADPPEEGAEGGDAAGSQEQIPPQVHGEFDWYDRMNVAHAKPNLAAIGPLMISGGPDTCIKAVWAQDHADQLSDVDKARLEE